MSDFDEIIAREDRQLGAFGKDVAPGEQGSVEWLYERVGHCTVSNFTDVMSKRKDGKEAADRAVYRIELVGERMTGQPSERFVSSYMKWGTENEAAARMAYEGRTNAIVLVPGFTKHKTIAWCGGSVDGLIDDDGIIEIKCPATKTHIETLLAGAMPEDHAPQVQGYLWITGRQWCDFVSYDPRMPRGLDIFIQRVARDDKYIELLCAEVDLFLKEVADQVTALHKIAAAHEVTESSASAEARPPQSGIGESQRTVGTADAAGPYATDKAALEAIGAAGALQIEFARIWAEAKGDPSRREAAKEVYERCKSTIAAADRTA